MPAQTWLVSIRQMIVNCVIMSLLRYLNPGSDLCEGVPGTSPLCLDVRNLPRWLSLCSQDVYLSKVGKENLRSFERYIIFSFQDSCQTLPPRLEFCAGCPLCAHPGGRAPDWIHQPPLRQHQGRILPLLRVCHPR